MSDVKKVVVLGAGYGGIEAALHIYRHSKKRKDIEITIIDKNEYHTLLTELHEVAGNRVAPDGLMINLEKIFEHTNVNVVKDRITGFDLDRQLL